MTVVETPQEDRQSALARGGRIETRDRGGGFPGGPTVHTCRGGWVATRDDESRRWDGGKSQEQW